PGCNKLHKAAQLQASGDPIEAPRLTQSGPTASPEASTWITLVHHQFVPCASGSFWTRHAPPPPTSRTFFFLLYTPPHSLTPLRTAEPNPIHRAPEVESHPSSHFSPTHTQRGTSR
uniref:Uncharacterized protein n=1 Tax=Aegilops tauschii subsp. strangulata TaxID=200361 RepID=A0A453PT51_AEGTS